MKIITWSEARDAGLRRWFTGEPCPAGHIAEKDMKHGCVACRSEWSKAYKLKKLLERGGVPWAKTEEERIARRRATLKRYRDNHPDRTRAAQEAYFAKHPERRRATKKKWNDANPDAVRLKHHRRRARKIGVVSKNAIKRLMTLQRGKCAACHCGGKLEVDHIVALAAGGVHSDENLQLLCGPCNRSKSAKDPIRWAQEQGRLL